jgi:hypothetical protein
MHRAGAYSVLLILGAVLVGAMSCRAPTEITLALSTDEKCTALHGTSVTVGRLGEIEAKASTTSSTFCDASGDLGALVGRFGSCRTRRCGSAFPCARRAMGCRVDRPRRACRGNA